MRVVFTSVPLAESKSTMKAIGCVVLSAFDVATAVVVAATVLVLCCCFKVPTQRTACRREKETWSASISHWEALPAGSKG